MYIHPNSHPNHSGEGYQALFSKYKYTKHKIQLQSMNRTWWRTGRRGVKPFCFQNTNTFKRQNTNTRCENTLVEEGGVGSQAFFSKYKYNIQSTNYKYNIQNKKYKYKYKPRWRKGGWGVEPSSSLRATFLPLIIVVHLERCFYIIIKIIFIHHA